MLVKNAMQDFYYCKDWYVDTWKLIKKLYSYKPRLFAACLAATSPRSSVKRNWTLAKRAYQDTVVNYNTWNGGYHYMACHSANLNRIYDAYVCNAGENLQLSGDKVNAFYHNITGNLNYVTIDIWMLRYFGLHGFTKANKVCTDYRVREIAEQYNLKPAEVQAILWSACRYHYGKNPSTFLIASVDDYQLQFLFAE